LKERDIPATTIQVSPSPFQPTYLLSPTFKLLALVTVLVLMAVVLFEAAVALTKNGL
jgi:hypothetical protein